MLAINCYHLIDSPGTKFLKSFIRSILNIILI